MHSGLKKKYSNQIDAQPLIPDRALSSHGIRLEIPPFGLSPRGRRPKAGVDNTYAFIRITSTQERVKKNSRNR
jgi:hypothetical protein